MTYFDFMRPFFMRKHSLSDPNRVHPAPQPENTSGDLYSRDDIDVARAEGIATGAAAGTAAGALASIGTGVAGLTAGITISNLQLESAVKDVLKAARKLPGFMKTRTIVAAVTTFGTAYRELGAVASAYADLYYKTYTTKADLWGKKSILKIKNIAVEALANGRVSNLTQAVEYAKRKVMHEGILKPEGVDNTDTTSCEGVKWLDTIPSLQEQLKKLPELIQQEVMSLKKHSFFQTFLLKWRIFSNSGPSVD